MFSSFEKWLKRYLMENTRRDVVRLADEVNNYIPQVFSIDSLKSRCLTSPYSQKVATFIAINTVD